MRLTPEVRKIINNYASETPGVKLNLARLLTHGSLGGSGKLKILAVDQGFEHGPRTFVTNPAAFDPMYHYQLAVDAKMNAYAAPLGFLEAGVEDYLGAIPTILKINSGNGLCNPENAPDQAITASVQDALRLGCSAIGFTIYPGSDLAYEQIEEIQGLSAEAKSYGLAVVIWSYPRGALSKEGETALDVIAYGAHMACQLGAHIVKVKLPTAHVSMNAAKTLYQKHVDGSTLDSRVRHVVQSCFNGRRLVIFSGGETKDTEAVKVDAQAVLDGGAAGVIIGRNCFQRPRDEALALLREIDKIMLSPASVIKF